MAFQSCFWPVAARAQPTVVSTRPDAVSITLYREEGLTSRDLQTDPNAADRGLVMITETRTVDLPAGAARIAFRGVADGMLPQTAAVSGVEAAESDFDYDLLTPGALAARSVGERVRLVRTDPATGRETTRAATIRSAPQGVVLALDDGSFEALDCSGLPEKLVFERAPPGLADRPTLSVLTRGATAGRRTIRLSYLATGLAWSADYVARLNPDGRTLDLTGWLTLANNGDTTFGQAPTDVVAGTLNREQVAAIEPTLLRREDRCWPRPVRWPTTSDLARRYRLEQSMAFAPPPPPSPPPMMAAMPVDEIVVTGAKMARQSELGDYKLYTLPEPTTVVARQVKQVAFLDKRGVPFDRVYEVRVEDLDDDPSAAPVLLRMRNTVAGRLGEPLPAGNVVVMDRSPGGRTMFAGEDDTEDTAVGLPFELTMGEASDVQASLVELDEREVGGDRVRGDFELTLTNAGAVGRRIEVRGPPFDGLRVVRSDVRHTTKDGAPLWTLDLKPNERRVFRYTLERDS